MVIFVAEIVADQPPILFSNGWKLSKKFRCEIVGSQAVVYVTPFEDDELSSNIR